MVSLRQEPEEPWTPSNGGEDDDLSWAIAASLADAGLAFFLYFTEV